MAGAGYKLFNTGDVLTAAQVNTYLMEQTVMVFDDAAARTTALTGVVSEGMISYLKDTNAVEVYNGSAWVASDDPNAIQNTIVDAKGDLITATAADTPARLAVGNNGETLVADGSTSTGLRWQPQKSVNGIINSSFDIWQRGTSVANGATYAYAADRWRMAASTAQTVSRQLSGLTGFQYCARIQRNSGSTSTTAIVLAYSFESVDSYKYAGKTITVSYYARAGSNYSNPSSNFQFYMGSGTGTDQNILGGYTGQATVIDQTHAITTSWQRFSFTGSVAANATEIGLSFNFYPTGTAGANDFVEVTGVQIEIGSVATPYQPYSATLAGELAACQRYYQRWSSASTQVGYYIGSGSSYFRWNWEIPVEMRTTPSVAYSGTVTAFNPVHAGQAITSITGNNSSNKIISLDGALAGAVGSNGAVYIVYLSGSAYVEASAEL